MNDLPHVTDEELQFLLEGMLGDADRSRVEAHVAGCTFCQQSLVSFEALSEALSGLPRAEPPAGFTAGVMARVDEMEAARAASRRVVVALLGALGATLLVAFLLAGQGAWASALSSASSAGVQAFQVARITMLVLSPIVSALRVPIVGFAAASAILLLLLLPRLASPRERLVA